MGLVFLFFVGELRALSSSEGRGEPKKLEDAWPETIIREGFSAMTLYCIMHHSVFVTRTRFYLLYLTCT